MTTTEPEQVKALYDNLVSFSMSAAGDTVWVMNNEMRFQFLPVAIATTGGDAGSARQIKTTSVKLFPGLNKVPKTYWDRIEADALRQRERNGGILAMTLDAKKVELVHPGKASAERVAGWLAMTANLQILSDMRKDRKHGEAAERFWNLWHDDAEASNHVKTLRHFWRMAEGSKKVA